MKNVKKTKKNLKFASLAWLLVVMLLAITIFINVAVSFFDVKIDMTPNSYYTMSQQSADYLNKLDKDVEITLLASINDMKSAPDANTMTAFFNILEEYDKFGRITVRDVDPNENPDIVSELDPEGFLSLQEYDIVVKCNDGAKRIPANKMYKTESSDESGSNVIQSETFCGEELITGAVKSLYEGYTPSVYFLTGHGEKSLDKDFTILKSMLVYDNYDVKELSLVTSEAVPDDAAIIVVPSPEKDISADEKSKLEKYLDNGGNLSLLMDPVNNNTDFDNLTDIMHQYCIGMDYDRVYETDDSMHYDKDKYTIIAELVSLSEDQESNEYDITSGFISSGKSDDLTDLTASIIEKADGSPRTPMTPSRSFFDYQGDNIGQLLICPLIQASTTAKAEAFGGGRHKTSDAELDRMNNSAEVSDNGFWLSAYSQDPTRNDSKLVVMGTSELIEDSQLQQGASLPSQLLYLSTISWMSGSDIEMGIPEKSVTYDHMDLETQDDTNFILVLLVAAPIIIAAAGVLIWLKRRHS